MLNSDDDWSPTKENYPAPRRRKSIAQKAASTFQSKDPILHHSEIEKNCPNPHRRKSVSKSISALPTDTVLQHHEYKDNLASLQKRKKSLSKAALTLINDDPILKLGKFEESHPHLQRRKSIAPRTASNADVALKCSNYILKQRGEFEAELRTYCGDDPLSVWCRYIKWVEQNFIKGGKDGNIKHLIEQCLNTLKNSKCYHNDVRFIEIWLKFADLSENPLEVYNSMYMQEIGCTSANFYIAWSSKLEEEGYIKKANKVLEEGIQGKSEPILKIKSYWSAFKARTGFEVLIDSDQNKNKLKDCKNSQQVMESDKSSVENDKLQPLSNRIFLNNGKVENPVSMKKNSSSSSYQCARPSFFLDQRLSIMPGVSSVQLNCENPEVALFEPFDPLKMPMYEKKKVYAGTQEISPEEIRAKAWLERKKNLDNEKRIVEQDKLLAEQMAKIKELELEIEKLKAEHLRYMTKQLVTAACPAAGTEIENESLVSVSHVQSQLEFSTDNCKAVIEDTKTQSQKTMKNAGKRELNPKAAAKDTKTQYQRTMKDISERELSPILESNEDNYRSSTDSAKAIQFRYQDINTSGNQNKTPLESQLSNQSNIFSNSVVNKTTKKSKNLSVTETSEDIDPFDERLNKGLLNSLNLPQSYYGNIKTSKESIDSFEEKGLIEVGNAKYVIENKISKGSYGTVYMATKQCSDSNTLKSKVAIKVSKHVSNWEIYICMTLHNRLENIKLLPDVSLSVMKITSAHKYSNAIIFTNEFSQNGTLLDLVYKYKSKQSSVPELLTMYITLEMLQVMSKMHECRIVHADVKPDNVLIRDNISKQDILDSLSRKTVLTKFIDFGRAIDLTLFKERTCFKTVLKNNKCIEMRENKPWVFQLDWYGFLNCIHVLLFATYMEVKKQANGRWCIQNRFRRYWEKSIWTLLFDDLLNIPSCFQEPVIEPHISRIEAKLKQNEKDFKKLEYLL